MSVLKEKSDNFVDIADDDDDDDLMAAITASLKDSKNISIKEDTEKVILTANLQHSFDSWQDDVAQITISRNKLFNATLKSIQRKSFSYVQPVCVTFASESAVDGGGPKNNNFTLLIRELANLKFFKHNWFVHDILALNENFYYQVGQFVCMECIAR